MATVTIKDTGKPNVGGADPGNTKANGGALITLPGVTISYGLESGLEDSAVVNKRTSTTGIFDYPEVDKMGVSAPSWTVNGIIDTGETTFNPALGQYGLDLIGILNTLLRSQGYKELTGDLPDYSAEATPGTTTVNCRVKSLSISDEAVSNICKWTLGLVETR